MQLLEEARTDEKKEPKIDGNFLRHNKQGLHKNIVRYSEITNVAKFLIM